MISAKNRISAMDDAQVVRYFESFCHQLFNGMTNSFDDVRSGITGETRNLDGWQQIESLTPEQAELLLPATEASAVARSLLLQMVESEAFGPIIASHLANYRDDELVVGTILAVGTVATVFLIITSTKFEYRDGKTSIVFESKPENVKPILEPFTMVVKKLIGFTE